MTGFVGGDSVVDLRRIAWRVGDAFHSRERVEAVIE